jgi:alpha-amylase
LIGLINDVYRTEDAAIIRDWKNLQTGDHFYYMSTKLFSDGAVHSYFNPYDGPYDAFINYNNILSDFTLRVKNILKVKFGDSEVDQLKLKLAEKELLLSKYEYQLLNKSISKPKIKVMATKKVTSKTKSAAVAAKKVVKKAAPKKAAKKAAPKKVVKKAAPKKAAAKKSVAKKTTKSAPKAKIVAKKK